jgi:hypothetical protein
LRRGEPDSNTLGTGRLKQIGLYAWTAPTTLIGLTAGALTLLSGGKVQRRRGALEFHGGFARWIACRVGFDAITLGHAILGRNEFCLEIVRDHEQAHVRQAERWGPAFIPAYLVASVLAWRRGEHYYRGNWFERDARRACGEPD